MKKKPISSRWKRRPVSLVTGGAGFIGSHVVEELLKMGHKVVVLDDFSGGFHSNIPDAQKRKGYVFQGDICDVTLVDGIFRDFHIDYVYHLAAYAAEGLSHHIRTFNYTNNLIGSANLINCAIRYGVKCFVFTSSIAVYGHVPKDQLPVTENTQCNPCDPYGIAKLAVEQDLKAAQQYYGLPFIIFRPHNVYGERQNIWDSYRNVVGIFMRQMKEKKPFTIFGDGYQRRAFTYVRDIAPTIARSVGKRSAYNHIFNIGSESPTSVKSLGYLIGGTHCMDRARHLKARKEVVDIYANHDNADRVFDMPNTPLSLGLQRMWDWAEKQPDRKPKKFRNIEINKNLPQSWK